MRNEKNVACIVERVSERDSLRKGASMLYIRDIYGAVIQGIRHVVSNPVEK